MFIVGAATAGGWDNPIDKVDPSTQQFTQINPTMYSITLPLAGASDYKMIGVNGSWNEQWSVATAEN